MNLKKNAKWAILEVIGASLALFVLYKIVISELGAEHLGIWSLVLSTTSFGRLADLGTAGGLNRFIATANAKNNSEKVVDYADTGILTNIVLYSLVTALIWWPAYIGLGWVMEGEYLEKGRDLLPFALASLILAGLAGTVSGAVIGQHRSDLKSKVTLCAIVLQVSAALYFVDEYGLLALAWGQISQYSFMIIIGWFLFLKNHYGRWVFHMPVRWDFSILKELLSFGIKLQGVSIVSMFYEPFIKFVMSSIGGLEVLGYFEMAQKMVLQVRQVVIMPIQPMVPTFAHFSENSPEKIQELYFKALPLAIILGSALMGGVIVMSPIVSYIWIGHFEPIFVIFLFFLPVGWFVNIVGAPSFMMGHGSGYLSGNLSGSALTTFGGLAISYSLGSVFGWIGVAIGANLMVAAGALLIMHMNCRHEKIEMFPPKESFLSLKSDIQAYIADYLGKK